MAVTYSSGAITKTGVVTTASSGVVALTALPLPVVLGTVVLPNNTASWNPALTVALPPTSLAGTYSGTINTLVAGAGLVVRRLLGLALIAGLFLSLLLVPATPSRILTPQRRGSECAGSTSPSLRPTIRSARTGHHRPRPTRPADRTQDRSRQSRHHRADGLPANPAAARVEKGAFVGEEGRTQNELSSWTAL